jgi:hypothetical protein
MSKTKPARLHPDAALAAFVRSPEGRANLERIGREFEAEEKARKASYAKAKAKPTK